MMSFIEFLESKQKEKGDPCWKGYKQVGEKKKGGRTVPNCVPTESQLIVPFDEENKSN